MSFDEQLSLEGEINVNEASKVLQKMNNNKSWIDLKSFVVNSINFGSLLGELSVTQKQGIITCLPKDNKPRHYATIYRRKRHIWFVTFDRL